MRGTSALLLVVALTLAGCSSGTPTGPVVSSPAALDTTPASPQTASSSALPTTSHSVPPTRSPVTTTTTVATGLSVPWGLALLGDGSALVTERDTARVLLVRPGARPRTLGRVPGVVPGGEGGLLGIALSPQFASDHQVFVYLSAAGDNRVMRMSLQDNVLRPGPVIVSGIPKAGNHNGGRLGFGPDGYLYVTTGDAGYRPNAQDKASLGGKILRVTADGQPAPGNPFPGSRIWSLGHRNVQGIAWDAQGRMYASEFGQDTWDELNLIRPGQNYGWPEVEGLGHRAGFTDPLVQWPTDDASPSGLAIGADGAAYLAALRGESLWRVPLDGGTSAGTPRRLLYRTYGRLRTVVSAPDGRLWLVTSNTFRGTPRPGDDRVIILPTDWYRQALP